MTLPEPRSAAGAHGLAALLQDPGSTLLALDFDGVLSPIVEDPARAYAEPRVVPALARLAPRLRAVAVVTGRPAQVAVELGGLDRRPELAGVRILGQYGLERMDSPAGPLRTPPPHAGVEAVRRALPDLLERLGAPEGVHVEDKGHALVLHVRRTADPTSAFERLRGPVTELARSHGLAAEPGRMVLELRPGGIDKGVALHALAAEFEPRTIAYAGDDLGDVPAYDAVEALRDEGMAGVLVYVAAVQSGERVEQLAARADLIVEGPAGLAAMLEALADRLGL